MFTPTTYKTENLCGVHVPNADVRVNSDNDKTEYW